MPRQSRLTLLCSLLVLVVALFAARPFAQAPAAPAGVRVDISGNWAVTISEDQPHRGPGPELGDYTGLPINAAARQKAEAWDATILSQPERQGQAHPAQYWMRGPGPALRILPILNPVTQVQFAYTIAGGFGRADRIVYIDGRNHPSDYAEHTWDGYSTGEWTPNGHFAITTTHMKYGVIQRNGAPASPYTKMTEHFVRHGLYLMLHTYLDDPIYLEEPMVRTHNWTWNPGAPMGLGNAFEAVDELGDKPLGWVPFFAMGVKQTEFGEMHNLPFKATMGGKESIYPEFMDKIKQFAIEEAAEKAAAAKKAEEAKAAASRRR